MIRLLAFYCVYLGSIHLAKVARAQSTCATPRGERGQCIQLQRCPSLYNSQQEQIRLYQCGNTNNPQNPFVMPINEVCCPGPQSDMNQQLGNQRPPYVQNSPYNQSPYQPLTGQSDYNSMYRPAYVSDPSYQPSSASMFDNNNQYYRPSSGQFGGNNRPLYDQSTYRPSLAPLDQTSYRPTQSSSHHRPTYDQSTYRPSSANDPSVYRPSTSSSQHRPSYDHRPSPPSSSSNSYRQRFTESDLPRGCGTQAKDRIVGGELTSIQDYPWMTLIHYSKRGRGGGFFCGGALIHENYVLTAAHCIRGTSLVKAGYAADSVRLGEYDLRSTTDCEEGECADPVQNIDVAYTIVHEQYYAEVDSQANDIALIRLARPAPYTDYIRPICLPAARHLRNKNLDDLPLVVAGFGKTENASRSDVKLKLEVNGINLDRCDDIYQRYLGVKLTSKQLCAGGEEGRDSCSGDSGGPLMGEDNTNSLNPYLYLAGIVSFGPTKCGTAGYPGVYTRTDQYIDWIINHMEK